MLTTQEYLFGWAMYVLSSVGLIVVWWRITYKLRPLLLRNILRLSAAVALLTPYPVPGQEAFLAPALIMSFIEGMFYEDYGFGHAGMPLIVAIVLANIVYLAVDLGWQYYRRKDKAAGENDNDPMADASPSREVHGDHERQEPRI